MDSDLPNADSQLHVEFYISKRENSKGKPYVKIVIPGDKNSIYDQPVRESHQKRFPMQWLYFQQTNGNMPLNGVSLADWAAERPEEITEGQLEELKSLRFQTVEQIATAPDVHLQRLMGGVGLRMKAQEYLKTKNQKATSSEVAELREALAEQSRQIAELLAKPKMGRPPNAKTEV